MQLSLLLSTVSVLQLGAFTFAHNARHDTPFPGRFGDQSAMRHLPRHLSEEVQGYSPSRIQKRGTNKKCGPGVGSCDSDDW